jgi:hypothetical protein
MCGQNETHILYTCNIIIMIYDKGCCGLILMTLIFFVIKQQPLLVTLVLSETLVKCESA